MATVALQVHLVGGDFMEVTYEGPDHADAGQVIDHVVSVLAQDSGVLHTRHAGRPAVLYGRGVAAIEISSSTTAT
jgi:hypothetical protein